MRSLVKWVVGGVATIIVLIIIVTLCIPLFIDPNDYKDKITQAVQEQTGRELTMPGDIKLSISPSLKAVFSLGGVNLASNQNFQGTDFFSSKLVEINLALWPLIKSKELQINNISLEGVNINLIRNSSGATNWDDLAGGDKKKTPDQQAPPSKEKQAAEKPTETLPKIDIGKIKVADINVTFTDQQAQRIVKLNDFNLNVGHITEGRPFPFDANFSVSMDDGKKPLTATTDLSGNLTFDLGNLLFLVDRLQLKSNISGAPVPVKIFGLEMNAKADLGKSLVDVSNLQITIDDTTIKGTASIANLQKPSYKTALHIDQLNLDRYKTENKATRKADGNTPAETAPAETTPAATATKQQQYEEEKDPIIIPVDLLRGLTFDAEIKIDKLVAAKLITTDILVKATGKEGLMQLQPFSANLYQGTIMVNGDIDARPDVTEMKLTKVLKGVELGPMFMEMKGKEEIKGTADIKANITTRGLTKKELTRNANGTMNIALANGEIAQLKIIDTIRVAKQLYEVASKDSSTTAATKKTQSGKPTSFANLSASGVITNGVFKNDDLLAESELMKVTGKGTVDFNTEQINYLLTIYLAKTLERDEEKDLVKMSDTPIPYKITGTFDKIEQAAALQEILKAGAIKLLSKELEKQFGGKDSKDGEKKDTDSSGSTEDLINKGLKSLFGN